MKKLQLATILLIVIAISVIAWLINRDRLPSEIRIAAGPIGGFYHTFAQAYALELENRSGKPVVLIETAGSLENQRIIEEGKADLALIQAGTTTADQIAILAPLFQEAVMLLAKRSSSINSVSDLQGRSLIQGADGSGMANSSQQILKHFEITPSSESPKSQNFSDLLPSTAEAAIVTSSILNPTLRKLARDKDVSIFPIEDAEALSQLNAHFTHFTVHQGIFGGRPDTPRKDLDTIATTACLASSASDFSPLLAQTALSTFYDTSLKNRFPNLIKKDKALSWDVYPLHPEAKAYFNPYEGLDTLTNFIESISGIKELFFAFGAAILLLLNYHKRRQEKEKQAELATLKERLDVFLERAIAIEKAQMDTQDPDALEAFLKQVTEIKLKALDELAHEDLRADANFTIFLTQCANLIRKLQGKIQFEDLRRNRPTYQNSPIAPSPKSENKSPD